jgi:hypothetical protein
MKSITSMWKKLSPHTREHVESAVKTFVATFITLSLTSLLAVGVESWDYALLTSVSVAALRGAIKVVVDSMQK